jgi:D-tyrosyl-tRNA(Tyr) deacylase
MVEGTPPFRIRSVVQRVSRASIHADGVHRGTIGKGLLVLFGVGWSAEANRSKTNLTPSGAQDPSLAQCIQDVNKLVDRLVNLRTFPDADGKMNLSLRDIEGGLALASQFTLFADLRKGTRPGFQDAAPPLAAQILYEEMCSQLFHALGPDRFVSGVFAADMDLDFINDGPVTYVLDIRAGKVLGAP